MFDKLLIANRGEIAARVIATARRMGLRTVAVYSEADRDALHVAMADEAVLIGPAAASESYLRAEAILDAARRTGAGAIHPGYGFLSENPDFVEAVQGAGLVFVGPPASAIRAMGLKDAAKVAMVEAGVPVVPGYHGRAQDLTTLADEAARIGYPVLIKARAGGGGKGMRLVERPEDFAQALEGAQREGQASFGDPAVLIEKYVTAPRHVEMQVFADGHGNVVHMFERDCSLQRRHQKVIEEAPAPGMTDEVREAMGRAAVEAARAIGYCGAGTVEFIADGSRGLRPDGFWFMEMNTRLQVEHPVSEAITGLDFVELQLRIAAGEPLPVTQEELHVDGHAFEARLYAEDVPKGFLPATGCLDHLSFPAGASFAPGPVRIDSGVRTGDEISPWYDPMIAKIVVHGPDRPTALSRLSRALENTRVSGTATNLTFLARLARHDGFARGDVDTGLIGRDLEPLSRPPEPPEDAEIVAALALAGLLEAPASSDPWARLRGFRLWGAHRFHARLFAGDDLIDLDLEIDGPTVRTPDGRTLSIRPEGDAAVVESGGHSRRLDVLRTGDHLTVHEGTRSATFRRHDPLDQQDAAAFGGGVVVAPMPGFVSRLSAEPGRTVTAGDALVVLEAMKMEHTLTAPRDGVIAEVAVQVGQQVGDGDILVTLEEVGDA
ncbi:acetyl/propionyl/methylcrotonyl-CoA carboxylase subunit alpha [Tranquillimonas alkanivorans]|uniref:3-methylcrotonyl-CoA carboxylase alpha subunit n=1 Tax=Tranquillimonas alkanivorans TaxID=441119 RepID=A0A1I5VFR6_9RHOB|nr:acetyl/propionyl/methylcrotonyl-CoA carboxylase subunit alpha [Tranquillimonas alkanivorans]SFQ06323.1 3-methylcrotonyl-CoA carboxylase alpha subunit [Tranquillimonas alkanivorans]